MQGRAAKGQRFCQIDVLVNKELAAVGRNRAAVGSAEGGGITRRQHAGRDDRGAGVAVARGQQHGAAAVLHQRAAAGDRVGDRDDIRAVEGQRAVVGDVARAERTGAAGIAHLHRAAVDDGGTDVRVVIFQGQGAGTALGQAAGTGDQTVAGNVIIVGRIHDDRGRRHGRRQINGRAVGTDVIKGHVIAVVEVIRAGAPEPVLVTAGVIPVIAGAIAVPDQIGRDARDHQADGFGGNTVREAEHQPGIRGGGRREIRQAAGQRAVLDQRIGAERRHGADIGDADRRGAIQIEGAGHQDFAVRARAEIKLRCAAAFK